MIAEIISRHERIALHVSGGKDSLATLYLLRPYWDKLTVYWLNSGDTVPATESMMREIASAILRRRALAVLSAESSGILE